MASLKTKEQAGLGQLSLPNHSLSNENYYLQAICEYKSGILGRVAHSSLVLA
jgi:hypothetical protein